jgi:hypothetical protein
MEIEKARGMLKVIMTMKTSQDGLHKRDEDQLDPKIKPRWTSKV